MKKIYKLISFILNCKLFFKKPKPVEILIYDKAFSEEIRVYLKDYTVDVLHIRGEAINLFILMRLIFKFPLKNLLHEYVKIYIQEVKPKIVITMTDNNINFYRLKKEIKEINFRTIAIQNGHRNLDSPDIINYYKDFNKSKLVADYILCFFSELEKIYKQIIQCKSIAIGSFLNNINFEKKKYSDGKNIKNFFWISQYRHRKLSQNIFDENFLSENQRNNFKNKSVDEHMDLERKILPIMYRFCKEKNLKFNIISSYKKTDNPEILIGEEIFYKNIINDPDWQMNENKKKNRTDVYKILLEEADIVAHNDSTLGYESLARGIKTISFISTKKSFYSNNFAQFSWPSKFNEKGPIWTNTDEENEILRLLNFIYSVSNEDWNNYIHTVKDKIMQTDKDNKIFSNLIEKLIKNDKI